ncbi:MAG TPA: NFACT RNA binding domain-containing protein [Thermoplasmata archaeon]|nr:NFACT RNA binding domain-containing protein [Thermoplasmata archaeon]
MVVGGRDAGSNDQLVKRHLKEGDIYVHADLHGAASVIVKHPAPGAPPLSETTYREAGQWAVAFSKAWRAGLASVSAFWVTHDQVSKAAMSGEFVARGAWVIHGTKHPLKDLPNELALGTIDYEGESLWTAAPPESLRRRGTIRFLLTPGPERERSDREEELVRELGISRPLLQSLLPAGGISVRRP